MTLPLLALHIPTDLLSYPRTEVMEEPKGGMTRGIFELRFFISSSGDN